MSPVHARGCFGLQASTPGPGPLLVPRGVVMGPEGRQTETHSSWALSAGLPSLGKGAGGSGMSVWPHKQITCDQLPGEASWLL